MIPGIEIAVDRAGLSALRISPAQNSLRFTTQAVGGFGECSFTLPGDPAQWKRQLPHLSTVRVVLDTFTLWEGRVEDITVNIAGAGLGARVSCFGFQRLLEDTPVRRIWEKRDLDWRRVPTAAGDKGWTQEYGQYEPADLSKQGVRFVGSGTAITSGNAARARYLAPNGLTLVRIMGTYDEVSGSTGNFSGLLSSSSDGTAFTNHTTTLASSDFDQALVANAILVDVGVVAGISTSFSEAAVADFRGMRVLGTSLTEDAAGGFYGGTILRDLIALVPGLTAGIIETGSDFTIQQIERAVRDNARSIVDEVAGYYSREWAVWEDQLFDWRTPALDAPHWLATIADLREGSELTSSVDGLASTLYVLYTDAADGRDKEASASSTSQRNPWVKQGKTRGELVQPGFPMTAASASQLASTLVAIDAQYPRIEGVFVLPASSELGHASAARRPAFMIRAGENITIADLPKSEFFTGGRDGETLFHVVATDCDLESGQVTVEVEGQARRADVLLARLAAATRTISG